MAGKYGGRAISCGVIGSWWDEAFRYVMASEGAGEWVVLVVIVRRTGGHKESCVVVWWCGGVVSCLFACDAANPIAVMSGVREDWLVVGRGGRAIRLTGRRETARAGEGSW